MKWQFIPQAKPGEPVKPHYVVVNADEGEPGTCRDLPLMMNDPHSMIEGIIIACYAVRAEHAFIYIRGEAVHAIRRVLAAVGEAYERGYLGAQHPRLRLRLRNHRALRRRRLHLRRGDGAARLAGGQARPASPQAAVPSHERPLRRANRRQQRRHAWPAFRTSSWAASDWFKLMGPEGSPGPCIYSLSGRIAGRVSTRPRWELRCAS